MSLSVDPDIVISFDSKLAFLRDHRSYPCCTASSLVAHETHMSWVFLVGDRAFKLKKPLRLSYLDFSSLEKREKVCREELRLNRRLAPDIYLGVIPLRLASTGLCFGTTGIIVDWLVMMRRLAKGSMLEDMLLQHRIQAPELDRLSHVLGRFYRYARKIHAQPDTWIAHWRQLIHSNRAVLFNDRFALSKAKLLRIDGALCRFLSERGHLIHARVKSGSDVEGHGDLRPEHILIRPSPAVIDCLEFNAQFREVDPLDEIAYLTVECERLGARTMGRRIETVLARALHVRPAPELLSFYRCYRAALKARLMLAHLLEANPRKPDIWRPLAKTYLDIADAEARNIQRALRGPDIPQVKISREGNGSHRRQARRMRGFPSCGPMRYPATQGVRYR